MWGPWKDDRGSGGPVLRDPLANRNRTQTLPYPNPQDFANRLNNNNISNNVTFERRNFSNGNMPAQSLFPPSPDKSFFPVPPSGFQQPPQGPQTQVPPIMNLGIRPDITSTNFDGHEPPTRVFRGSTGQGLLPLADDMGNNSFNIQQKPHFLPQQLVPPPVSAALLQMPNHIQQQHFRPALVQPPAMLPMSSPNNFQDLRQTTFLGPPNQGFNNPANLFYQREPEKTLNLQPQWSVQNGKFSGHQVRRTTFHVVHPNTPPGFERRPFVPQQNQIGGFDKQNVKDKNTSQQSKSTTGHHSQQSTQSFVCIGSTGTPFNSKAQQSDTDSSSNLSFPSSRSHNTQNDRLSSFGSLSQQPIPSLMNRSAVPGIKNNVKPLGKNSNNEAKFSNKFPVKHHVTTGIASNSNNIRITPSKAHSGPLLPTPKLIPYPPPRFNSKSVNTPALLPRHPRGILKNAGDSRYSNFVKERDSSDNSPSAVVPYAIEKDDDDDDDIESLDEENCENPSSSMTHDFFSEKVVQHFMSLFNGKTLEEQLDDLMKYLVLPADFLSTRVSIVRNLHLLLCDTFKKSVLQPYGADFIGIGNSDDSVNVFVDLTGKQGPYLQIDARVIEPLDVTKETLEELMNLIQEDKNHKFFGQIVRRTNFSNNGINLPVISFIHSETKVRCNIRLDNYLLVQEAKVIQFVCSLDTRIPALLALVRYWSSVHKVLDTPEEDTKNRFVTLLMLFFLADKKIIPTMAHIQSLSVKREYFNNLDIGFCDDHSLVPANENPFLEDKTVLTLSTLSLLKEYFKLFAKAKLKEDVISLWKAEFIPKENFSPELEGKVLSPDLRKRYRYGINGKLRDKRLDCGGSMCIQDFQDLSENLSLDVAEYDISKFQVECLDAHRKLENIMASGSGNLMDLFVVSEYATYGTPSHRSLHRLYYLFESIADEQRKRNRESQKDLKDVNT